jgi:hypothetical protein
MNQNSAANEILAVRSAATIINTAIIDRVNPIIGSITEARYNTVQLRNSVGYQFIWAY